MKTCLLLLATALFLWPAASRGDGKNGLPTDVHELKIGDAAPAFSLPGTDGKTHTLAEFSGAKVLMVAFLPTIAPPRTRSRVG